MSLPTEAVSPKATPLPPLPAEDPLSEGQWKTLLAIADAFIPALKPIATARVTTELAVKDNDYSAAVGALKSLTPDSDPDADAAAKGYLDDYASSNPAFKQEFQRIFGVCMPHSLRKEVGMVLNVLK